MTVEDKIAVNEVILEKIRRSILKVEYDINSARLPKRTPHAVIIINETS